MTKPSWLSSKVNLISTWKKEIGQISLKDHYEKHFREVWISKIHQEKCIAEMIYFMPT